jgi:hypothetical protein
MLPVGPPIYLRSTHTHQRNAVCSVSRSHVGRTRDQGASRKCPWLGEMLVGDTGFEPVTSFVSAISDAPDGCSGSEAEVRGFISGAPVAIGEDVSIRCCTMSPVDLFVTG